VEEHEPTLDWEGRSYGEGYFFLLKRLNYNIDVNLKKIRISFPEPPSTTLDLPN
jgi:hypothetical protein